MLSVIFFGEKIGEKWWKSSISWFLNATRIRSLSEKMGYNCM